LTDPGNNGRIGYWTVAWHQFQSAPTDGHGAGTYQDAFARYRQVDYPVLDAHSLYLETLDELGVVGFALLLTTMLTVLVRTASRARGSGRPLYAAIFAVLLAWTIHAGVDWDWEMPVLTIVFFSLGGAVLARRPGRGRAVDSGMSIGSGFSRTWIFRGALALGFLLVALLPAYVWLSQSKLDDADYAFARGNCAAARQSALSSISMLGNRAEPYELLSYCDLRLGMPHAALSAMNKAVSLDPNNWNYRYGLVLMRAAAGLDPRGAASAALSLNPRDALVRQAWNAFRTGTPKQWEVEARSIASAFTTL
jgi:tetratricopeptide (TPR) repeat protein